MGRECDGLRCYPSNGLFICSASHEDNAMRCIPESTASSEDALRALALNSTSSTLRHAFEQCLLAAELHLVGRMLYKDTMVMGNGEIRLVKKVTL